MTSLQTTPGSSARGRVDNKRSSTASVIQEQGASLEDRKVGAKRGGAVLKHAPSRSGSCSSAEGDNESTRSSSVSIPDNTQLHSPNSEYLCGSKAERAVQYPHSSGRHAGNMHASTVESSHKSLLCAEVLSLKAALEA